MRPVITPRFALSCDMKLMQELAKIAKAKDLHIQVFHSHNIHIMHNISLAIDSLMHRIVLIHGLLHF